MGAHDLVRVPAEDRRQVATVINGREYRARSGYFEMRPEHAKAHLVHGNQPTPAAAGPIGRRGGYRCNTCGFGSYFTLCSRCDGSCERERN